MKYIMFLGATIPVMVATYYATDYLGVRPVILKEYQVTMNQVEQNSKTILLIRLQFLMDKRKIGSLTFEEQQELCHIAKALDFVGVPGC